MFVSSAAPLYLLGAAPSSKFLQTHMSTGCAPPGDGSSGRPGAGAVGLCSCLSNGRFWRQHIRGQHFFRGGEQIGPIRFFVGNCVTWRASVGLAYWSGSNHSRFVLDNISSPVGSMRALPCAHECASHRSSLPQIFTSTNGGSEMGDQIDRPSAAFQIPQIISSFGLKVQVVDGTIHR